MHTTLLHVISLSILITFLFLKKNPSLRFSQICIEHPPFHRARTGIFPLPWNFVPSPPAFTSSSLGFSPRPSQPCWCLHGRAIFLGCSGPQPSLTHEHLSPSIVHLALSHKWPCDMYQNSHVLSSTIVFSFLGPVSPDIVFASSGT